MTRSLFGIVILAFWLWALPLQAQNIRLGRITIASISVNNQERQYRLYVPRSYDTSQPAPLVLVLHGGGGNARSMVRYVGDSFHAVAERDGVIIAYPEAIEGTWNDGRGLDVTAQRDNIDDVAFITQLIDHLSTELAIDPQRIYATGISNGGHMSFRLACQVPEKLAAIAIVTASLSESLAAACSPAQAISVMLMNGVEDPISPYEGGEIRVGNTVRGRVLSTDATIQFWATHNQCADEVSQTTQDNIADDGTSLVITRYNACNENTSVLLYSIVGGGHTWAGMRQYLGERLIGITSREVDGVEAIWAFFQEFQRSN
jgi:polyhydroxybutyrate depolymerase